MKDRSIESHSLHSFWSTLRETLQPDLSSPLAQDRAKRADMALVRLVAGYGQLPSLRLDYDDRYREVLARWRQRIPPDGNAEALTEALADNPIFVGSPGSAPALEHLLLGSSESDQLGDDDFFAMLGDIVTVEESMRSDYESRVAAIKPVTAQSDSPLTAAALQMYLRQHPEGEPRVEVESIDEIPGGRSKRTVMAALRNPGRLPPEIVLRVDTGRGVGTEVANEYPLLDRVAKAGLPVAEPLWLERSNAPFGQPFIVFRRMPGSAAGDLRGGAFRKVPDTALALARALGALHRAGVDLIDDPAMRGSAVPHTIQLLDDYHDRWTSTKPFPSLIIEAAFAWLRRSVNRGLGEATVVHADTAFHNLLIDDQFNAVLVDWEFAHFGDGAEDLASCRPAVQALIPWDDFLQAYYEAGGLPVTEFQLRYFDVWRPLRNAAACGGVLNLMLDRGADDIDAVTIGLSTFQWLQADLATSLLKVLNNGDGHDKR